VEEKNILIGVTGSIAVYKSCQLVRLFKKEGHRVRVVMSEDAKKFITPLTFETLTGEPVLHRANEQWDGEVNHIGYARWADLYIIAPATANTLNKGVAGIGDNLPLQVYLATTAPTLFAPSANTQMIYHPTTQRSLGILPIIPSGIGELACGEVGEGKMAEPEEIFWWGLRTLHRDKFWKGKKVVITAGGSKEPIDDVRCITNYSSGKMGEGIALGFYLAGAKVVLISSVTHYNLPTDIKVIKVERGEDYLREIVRHQPDCLIMAAAIADYRPPYTPGKLKKEKVGKKFKLQLEQNIDVLENLKGFNFIKIGFKAEVDQQEGEKRAFKTMERKGLDAICLNYISEHPFGSDYNRLTILFPNLPKVELSGSKKKIGTLLPNLVKGIFFQKHNC